MLILSHEFPLLCTITEDFEYLFLMKAAIYHQFKGELSIENVPDPIESPKGVVLKVMATGLCRSDWHGWMGHDPDITLPNVPGHELSGIVVSVGASVKNWKKGARVTVPFVCACGHCPTCHSGNQQICDNQFQPGFTAWGSFAEYVAIDNADVNLVKLPEKIDFETAASLGCRFITSFRGIVDQGKVTAGQWVAVHGCGGVGLSAIMIAKAMGAFVIAIDIDDEKLTLACRLGAHHTINATKTSNLIEEVQSLSNGGVHVSMDALGSNVTCFNSIANLRKRGKHIQVGLMSGGDHLPPLPMHLVIARELEILGSHGIQAHRYPSILDMISNDLLSPSLLIGSKISLAEGAKLLPKMNEFQGRGVTVINSFI